MHPTLITALLIFLLEHAGIAYYEALFTSSTKVFKSSKARILYDFLFGKDPLEALVLEIEGLEIATT
ncbi:hypothetical protein SAMN05421636_105212 [Pricia antarctica]|uniref:Uncharacterized protein n=1 Tax=Pricia antarctica TaxID=641691 RepID=A0A1G7D7X7_9FLAO|nr:hypothetical protein SAMN05421636_105212 [Pricia antarctica]